MQGSQTWKKFCEKGPKVFSLFVGPPARSLPVGELYGLHEPREDCRDVRGACISVEPGQGTGRCMLSPSPYSCLQGVRGLWQGANRLAKDQTQGTAYLLTEALQQHSGCMLRGTLQSTYHRDVCSEATSGKAQLALCLW